MNVLSPYMRMLSYPALTPPPDLQAWAVPKVMIMQPPARTPHGCSACAPTPTCLHCTLTAGKQPTCTPSCSLLHPPAPTGLGRAPATAMAYMHWLRGWDLQEAYDLLTSTRSCSPRIEAIRAATADLLTGSGPIPMTISLPRRGTARVAQISGLDVGWHRRINLQENPVTKRLEVRGASGAGEGAGGGVQGGGSGG